MQTELNVNDFITKVIPEFKFSDHVGITIFKCIDSKNKGIIILVQDFNNPNNNNISDEYFIIIYYSSNSPIKHISSKNTDFSFCNDDPILFDNEVQIENIKYSNDNKKKLDINKILYGRKLG